MLGMIYTEFLNMAEDTFGVDTTEDMIEKSLPNLPSKAVYTSVGNYSHKEIIVLNNNWILQNIHHNIIPFTKQTYYARA